MKIRRKGFDTALSVILIILITASVVQAVILWTSQTAGNNTGYLSKSSTMNDATVIDELFKPYNMILSSGNGVEKLIIGPANKDFAVLWEEAAAYLKDAFSAKSTTMDSNEWRSLYSKSAVIFEFKVNIRSELLSWFMGTGKLPASDLSGVCKMALSYDENKSGKMIVYIMDDADVHIFEMPFKNHDRQYFSKTVVANYALKENISYTLGPGELVVVARDDLLLSGDGDTTAKYGLLLLKAPDALVIPDTESQVYQRNIANTLLSSERYSYETDVTKNGTLTIANLNNIYSLDLNGYLEYESKTAQDETIVKGNIKDAFVNALKFIYNYNRRNLASSVNLFISDIIENKGSYTFIFGYRISGTAMVPVYIDYKTTINGNPVKADDAIRIVSTGSTVLSAKWLIRQAEKLPGEIELSIQPDFTALNKLMLTIGDAQMKLIDVNPAYIVSSVDKSSGTRPIWVVTTNSEKRRYLYSDEVQ